MLDRLGSGDLAVLGDMADQKDRSTGGFRIPHQIEARGTHLRDGPGSGFEGSGPDRLDRVDGDNARRFSRFEGGENILDRGCRTERERRIRKAHARGAHARICASASSPEM